MKNKILGELLSKVKEVGKSVVEAGWTVDGKIVIEAPLKCREYVRCIIAMENNEQVHFIILDVLKGRRYWRNPELVAYILDALNRQNDYFEVRMERADIIIYGSFEGTGITSEDLLQLFRIGMRFANDVFCELETVLL